jgi:hypothetical protein
MKLTIVDPAKNTLMQPSQTQHRQVTNITTQFHSKKSSQASKFWMPTGGKKSFQESQMINPLQAAPYIPK